MLRFLLRPPVLAILVTLLIWLVVIIYWQETVREVSGTDIALYMVGLPLLVIGLGFGVRWLYHHRTAAAPQASAEEEGRAVPPATDADERGFTLALHAVGLVGSGADILSDIKANNKRPMPDTELKDRDGFPVTACRVADLDTATAQTTLFAGARRPSDAVVRGLALLEQAMAPVFDVLAKFAPPAEQSKRQPAAPPSQLHVDLLVPGAWDEEVRGSVGRHLGTLLAESGWSAEASKINIGVAATGGDALRRLDNFCVNANRDQSKDLYLLAACESAIDEETVASLDANGQLFGVGNPQGCVPGESAAVVLVQASRGLSPDAAPMAILSRTAFRQRDKSADAAGRISHELLEETARQCLEATAAKADDISTVVSDVDHRASRVGECLGTLNALLPDLDPAKQFAGIGQLLGRLDVCGPVLALGVATAAAQAEEKPVLLLVASHAKERAAAIIKPYAAAEPIADAAAA